MSGPEKLPARIAKAFRPPPLPPVSGRAFQLHMAYVVLAAISHGILVNVPVMAVKALQGTDTQLQLPQAIASFGLFVSAFTGVAMARRYKKPFVWAPGLIGSLAIVAMAWTVSPLWFLGVYGLFLVFDFAIRPAIPSIVRSLYPDHCRAHISGTLQQYSNIVLLVSSLLSSYLLSAAGDHIRGTITSELLLSGAASIAAFLCFSRLPNHADGSLDEAEPSRAVSAGPHRRRGPISFAPLRDPRFRIYVAIVFLFACGDLYYSGIVPAFFTRDLGFGYVESALFLQIVPSTTAFLLGGRLTAWFDRTSIWRSYAVVGLLWGLDPILLAIAPGWPVVAMARFAAGPAHVGSAVLHDYTGIHAFARPGPDTSYYTGTLFFFNGLARSIAPSLTAMSVGHLSYRAILLIGGLAVLTAGALFRLNDRRDSEIHTYASGNTC
jgi:hypothetical protein